MTRNTSTNRKRLRSLAFGVLLIFGIAGCTAFGVVATNDPYEKMAQANRMEDRGRIAVAQRLMRESIEIFEQSGDQLALAEAYRRYAFSVRVNGEDTITRYGGAGSAVPTNKDGRQDKSIAYFEKSLSIFEAHGKHDMAANLHYNIAGSHQFAGRPSEACIELDKSLESHRKAMQANPTGVVDLPSGVATFTEFIDRARAESGCQ